ncbi:Rossmann-like and DUF2520 domain-containing protein [Helicovermis profundi]|uniref:Rossmann-like and DUF2520 domain-containing protein n=1 Tax=Helicovermis profundi TaxID=3065157 RepID=A0AAU9EMJ5_9FIRM|nr:Rossmann-like and DUF2520 domain-containing protein [Clostridia bacterium S502]
MKIGFIGAGKVGTAFGMYLKENNFDISGYFSKSLNSAKLAAKFTNSTYFNSLEKVLIESKIVFVTTNDDQIMNVVKEIKKYREINENKIYVHMSGSLSTNVFDSLLKTNSSFYSIHPLASFAKKIESVKNLEDAVFTIEGLSKKHDDTIVINLINKLGNKYFKIDKNQKVKYHMAACIASNYLDTILDLALEMFSSIGIENEEGFNALKPLIYGTLNNIENFGTKEAITGPISRGDYNTIKSHLSEINDEELKNLYLTLGRRTLEISKKRKLKDKNSIDELEKILGKNY